MKQTHSGLCKKIRVYPSDPCHPCSRFDFLKMCPNGKVNHRQPFHLPSFVLLNQTKNISNEVLKYCRTQTTPVYSLIERVLNAYSMRHDLI